MVMSLSFLKVQVFWKYDKGLEAAMSKKTEWLIKTEEQQEENEWQDKQSGIQRTTQAEAGKI